MSLKSLGRSAFVPSSVDPAALDAGIGGVLLEAIEDLDFIAPHEVHARIGVLGDHEFDVGADVAEVLVAEQMFRSTDRAIDDRARSRFAGQLLHIIRAQLRITHDFPLSCVTVPGGKVFARELKLVTFAAILGSQIAGGQ